jgi:hypothetical protein
MEAERVEQVGFQSPPLLSVMSLPSGNSTIAGGTA